MEEPVVAPEILVQPLAAVLGRLDPNDLAAIQRALVPEA
jgi:hypothetical protein